MGKEALLPVRQVWDQPAVIVTERLWDEGMVSGDVLQGKASLGTGGLPAPHTLAETADSFACPSLGYHRGVPASLCRPPWNRVCLRPGKHRSLASQPLRVGVFEFTCLPNPSS